ncbi:unnamed protein product [Coffea canephora]|uniref:Cupin type-1 domain-containing protein n=1 Tax=Coffea canephora TaxID=49390 RepID=A0A068VCT4_COFCA|nr:unnamed protein product [Coffea canephora]
MSKRVLGQVNSQTVSSPKLTNQPTFTSSSPFHHCFHHDRAQIVGVDGKRVLETTVKAGNLFIVPRFFVVSKIADADGLEWFSIVTTPDPIFTHMAGRTSVWKALSPEVLQASFKVSPEVEQQFRSKRTAEEIFFPPN